MIPVNIKSELKTADLLVVTSFLDQNNVGRIIPADFPVHHIDFLHVAIHQRGGMLEFLVIAVSIRLRVPLSPETIPLKQVA